ncbi:MAG: 30S ribosomal protein S8 [Clostridiales bacterium]|nr:30S ribosomal protein S8 [Clostridiales bacterium]
MQVTDPVSDMLTRIRNANLSRHKIVDIPSSKLKKAIAQILFEQGFIKKVEYLNENVQGVIRISLKYLDNKKRVLKGLKRVSKPGRRLYVSRFNLPYVLKGLGIAIVSTSKGILIDKEARKQNIGGEILAFIW